MMKSARLAVPALVAAAVLVTAGCAVWRLDESRKLARDSEPFSNAPPDANARLLVVGDSTAVGTGARTPQGSLAGQLAKALPRLSITNAGTDGARFADVAEQLASVGAVRFDVVLIQAGGNDVIRLTSRTRLATDVDLAVSRASALAPLVIVMPAGNVGNAPFFFAPWSWWMTARAETLHDIVRETAQRRGAAYVNLYKPKRDDPFAQQPERLHAADGLHPSGEGYAEWLTELLAQSPLAAALGERR